MMADGRLAAGGAFTTAGGHVAAHVTTMATSCAADAAEAGAGCAGPFGQLTLHAENLPFAGSTLRLSGSNLPAPAFVLAISGLTPVVPGVPLATVFASALPGCDAHVELDVVDLLLTSSGPSAVQWTLALPDTAAIAGLEFWHQMVAIEVDPALEVLAMATTNSLRLTAGFF
jgi:hypothetical protein